MRNAIAVIAALLALIACSADAEPETEPAPTAASPPPLKPTTTAHAALPSTPEDAIRAWVEASDLMQATGETSVFLSLSTDDCEPCLATAQRIVDIYEAGGSAESPQTEVVSIQGRVTNDDFRYITATTTSPTTAVVNENGLTRKFPGGPEILSFQLEGHGATNWRIKHVEIVRQ